MERRNVLFAAAIAGSFLFGCGFGNDTNRSVAPHPAPKPPEVAVGAVVPLDAVVLALGLKGGETVTLRNGPFTYEYPCWERLTTEQRFDLGYARYDSQWRTTLTETTERGRACGLALLPSDVRVKVIALPEELPNEALVRLEGWTHPLLDPARRSCEKDGGDPPHIPGGYDLLRTCPTGAMFYVPVPSLIAAMGMRDYAVRSLKNARTQRLQRESLEYLRRRAAREAERAAKAP